MHAAVHVGIAAAVVVLHGSEDRERLLGSCCAIEVHEWLVMGELEGAEATKCGQGWNERK